MVESLGVYKKSSPQLPQWLAELKTYSNLRPSCFTAAERPLHANYRQKIFNTEAFLKVERSSFEMDTHVIMAGEQ